MQKKGGGGEGVQITCKIAYILNGRPPTILGGNSYLSWFYDRGAIKDPAHTGTSKGLSPAKIGDQLENSCQSMQMFM